MNRELICIVCPNGCRLSVEMEGAGGATASRLAENNELRLAGTASPHLSVSGGLCKRGDTYAKQECVAPMRMVTTLVRVAGRRAPLSVKTAAPIPKDKIFAVLAAVHAVEVSAPVRIGAVIVADVCGTGVDIIATSTA